MSRDLDIQKIQPGDSIVLTCQGGHDWERREAREMLSLDIQYTIATIDISSWSTAITLVEAPDHRFNSCLFSYPPA